MNNDMQTNLSGLNWKHKYAVIPTHDRPEDFEDSYDAIRRQVEAVIVVSHGADYVKPARDLYVVEYEREVPNISEMWNLGIDVADRLTRGENYYIAFLNDDAIVPAGWFNTVVGGMENQHAVMGAIARDYDSRPSGYAFILDSRAGLRFDEQFVWWCGDDDMEYQARRAGGVAQPRGAVVQHRHPNSTTIGELADIAQQDMTRFRTKWGLPV